MGAGKTWKTQIRILEYGPYAGKGGKPSIDVMFEGFWSAVVETASMTDDEVFEALIAQDMKAAGKGGWKGKGKH